MEPKYNKYRDKTSRKWIVTCLGREIARADNSVDAERIIISWINYEIRFGVDLAKPRCLNCGGIDALATEPQTNRHGVTIPELYKTVCHICGDERESAPAAQPKTA